MKKFLLKISIFMIYAVLLSVIFPVAVDQFNIFHFENKRYTGVGHNNHYIKMKYILKHKDRFDGYSFIFGSSRVGFINPDKTPDSKIFDMDYSAALPSENLANLRTFLKNNIHPSRIYLGVDSLSYTETVKNHIYQPLYCPYEYLRDNPLLFCSLFMRPASTIHSLAIRLSKKPSSEDNGSFYRIGTTIQYGRKSSYNWSSARPSVGPVSLKDIPQSISDAIKDVKEFADICRTSGIDLVLFTNPMHHVTYNASVNLGWFDFLERLAEISDFWNFSGLNDITLSNDLYMETSHFKPEVGDMMIDAMCYGKADPKLQAQGFGFKVTRENVKDFIAMLKQQAESFTQKNSPAN